MPRKFVDIQYYVGSVIVGLSIVTYSHVVRWDGEGVVTNPTQLTLPDFSHDITMDKVGYYDKLMTCSLTHSLTPQSCNMFITTYSSLQATPLSSLYRISHKDDLTIGSQHCCNIGTQTSMLNILYVFLVVYSSAGNKDRSEIGWLFLKIGHFIGY